MNQFHRLTVASMADELGLVSHEFGEEEIDRFIIVYKVRHAQTHTHSRIHTQSKQSGIVVEDFDRALYTVRQCTVQSGRDVVEVWNLTGLSTVGHSAQTVHSTEWKSGT
jgi:hypothetical protein